MRLTTIKAIVAAAVVVAVVPSSAYAYAYSFRNPLDGCTYTVWGPDITVSTIPDPGYTMTGGFGESVSCA